jgi:SPP1 gp7 family putative phage head morphogenesis protein
MAWYNPKTWRTGTKALPGTRSTAAAREASAQGPYTDLFETFVARQVNPYLYEALREAVGPLDGAINRLCTLDGIIRVEGNNDRLVSEIQGWMDGIKVQDVHQGFQSWCNLLGNEKYEQGFVIGEWVLNKNKTDVERLKIADSKGIYFKRKTSGELETWYRPPAKMRGRNDGTDNIERVLRNTYMAQTTIGAYLDSNNYRKLNPAALVYLGFNNEAENPYGVSLIRGTEFDSKVLLTIKNALFNVWDRFGDPIFDVKLKKKKQKTPAELLVEQTALSKSIANVFAIKRQGNSADLVNVIGSGDELEISILGAEGQVLQVEADARHLLEQIVAKTGLPSWLLGFHWSTAERLAEQQGTMIIQESRTRFEVSKPALRAPIEAMLRARGITFQRGDWDVIQELPNLQDMLKQAQANFLNTQAELMQRGGTTNPTGDNSPKGALVDFGGSIIYPSSPVANMSKALAHAQCKTETYVEDASALNRLEANAELGLKKQWNGLYADTLAALDITETKAPAPIFLFDQTTMLPLLLNLESDFIAQIGAHDAELAANLYRAWVRGLRNAAIELDVADTLSESLAARVSRELGANAFELVRDVTLRAYRNDIVLALENGVYNGLNPREVARQLKQRFDVHGADWERLARSEIAAAQGRGKLDQYADAGISRYDWVRAGGACPICIGLEAGGPYQVGTGPKPVRDSHPNCRCTVSAVADENL